ncbi:hypothetical protein C0J52_25545 [Blattella germanica]|nr:hypothetical protein C0J52_25545 [Blattella germanica]
MRKLVSAVYFMHSRGVVHRDLKPENSSPFTNIATTEDDHCRKNVRKRAVFLVSHAYSSIGMDDLAAFVGMPCDQAVKAASDQGWVVDAPCRMVRPCRPPVSQNQGASSEDQLYKLTEFVSFLEN